MLRMDIQRFVGGKGREAGSFKLNLTVASYSLHTDGCGKKTKRLTKLSDKLYFQPIIIKFLSHRYVVFKVNIRVVDWDRAESGILEQSGSESLTEKIKDFSTEFKFLH